MFFLHMSYVLYIIHIPTMVAIAIPTNGIVDNETLLMISVIGTYLKRF